MRSLKVVIGKVPVLVDMTIIIPIILFTILGFPHYYFIALFFSILHEFTHLGVARMLGYTPLHITLNMFGEVLALKEHEIWPEHQVLIHLSGPLFNLFTSFIFFLFFYEAAPFLIELIILINLFLALFNLIPCYPLDGGKVVMVYLSYYFGEEIGEKITFIIGKIIAIFTFALGIYLMQFQLTNGLISALAIHIYLGIEGQQKDKLFVKIQNERKNYQ